MLSSSGFIGISSVKFQLGWWMWFNTEHKLQFYNVLNHKIINKMWVRKWRTEGHKHMICPVLHKDHASTNDSKVRLKL